MAMNFPNSPAIGDKYPVSPPAGAPQYTWNGQIWTTLGIGLPGPGKVPVYTDGSNPMTADLILANSTPANSLSATSKAYVDNHAPMTGSVRYDVAQSLTGAQQVQAQNNIGGAIPAGTVMVFYQAAAPTGWTKVTTNNDKALRVVSGSGGVAGGTNPYSTVMAQTTSGLHTLTRNELPTGITSAASNTITVYLGANSANYAPLCQSGWAQLGLGTGFYYGPITGGGGANAMNGYASYGQYANTIQVTSNNTGANAHNHPLTMDMQYCDVILASKN